MDDVVRNVREEFLNEGVDLEILEDLRRVYSVYGRVYSVLYVAVTGRKQTSIIRI